MLREIVPPDTGLAFAAMQHLRTDLTSLKDFVEQVDSIQRPAGYRLVGVLPDDGTDAVAVAGFRLSTSLSWGRHVYIDDLSTAPSARRRGFAGKLLEWIHAEAERLGCEQVHLDSGVDPSRFAAHRLYLNSGYVISAHHFARRISSGLPVEGRGMSVAAGCRKPGGAGDLRSSCRGLL
jgi:GNAT superfamily N-acetyltransferase